MRAECSSPWFFRKKQRMAKIIKPDFQFSSVSVISSSNTGFKVPFRPICLTAGVPVKPGSSHTSRFTRCRGRRVFSIKSRGATSIWSGASGGALGRWPMEAARALLGGIAAAVSGRAVSGSAASGPGTPRWRELRPGYNRLDRRSAGEARFAVAPRAGEVRCFARDSVRWFAGTPTKGSGWRGSHVLPTTCRRGARVTTNSVADATGGDPGDDKTRSPPSRPRRGRNVRSSSASPGSSFSETAAADTAPTQNTRAAAAAKRLRSTNMKSPAATKALSSVRATAGAGARVGRGEDGRGGLSRERENVYESEPPRERVPNDRASHRETEVGNATVNSLPTLRKEASTILRARRGRPRAV